MKEAKVQSKLFIFMQIALFCVLSFSFLFFLFTYKGASALDLASTNSTLVGEGVLGNTNGLEFSFSETSTSTEVSDSSPLNVEYKGADYIVLGCTHYPFLEDTIRKCAPGVGIINPAEAVAKHTADILQDNGYVFGNGGSLELLSSGDGTILEKMARSLPLENGFAIVRASTESSR